MPNFAIQWKGGAIDIIYGSNIAEAFISKGWANNATINKLEFWSELSGTADQLKAQLPVDLELTVPEEIEVYDDNSLMNYGKYNGYKMANIPESYLRWLYENDRCTPPVKAYIENNADYIGIRIKA